MKKVSKILTVARAFTSTSTIDETILKQRREICSTCDFNSNNVESKDMGFIEKARKKLLDNEPFCTACGCQVNEKTSQDTEECGLSEKGLKPKWNRLKLETTNRLDLNLINKSSEYVNIDLAKNKLAFEINYGEVNKETLSEIEFLLKSKVGVEFSMTKFRPSCGSCTKATYEKIDSHTYKANVKLNTTNMMSGLFRKTIYLTYKLNNLERTSEIKLVGTTK